MPNRLAKESSPYLLQHAHNPVDWYPWGEEALQKAKKEDKPILVSIGYSACHWCHVMERESFEDAETASIMNAGFVNIKIDREERPDLDHIYMDAVQAMTGSGGWPLNVFLTPEGKPFFGGTYFPPRRAVNRASWKEILSSITAAFREKRQEIESQSEYLVAHLISANDFGREQKNQPDDDPAMVFNKESLRQIYEEIMKAADKDQGGFGRAPKFPQTFTIQFLLRYYYFTKDEAALNQACLSLDKMIQGGINDHIGGGFARYATDEDWFLPHFEKMLYDNALLVTVISEAWQLTRRDHYRRALVHTLEFINREMLSPEGGFYSALDADSEGEEGKYYVWHKSEIEQVLGNDAALFCRYYHVSEKGNWEEGKNILHTKMEEADFARRENLSPEELLQKLETGRKKLLEKRNHRVPPQLDDKILLGWNALMISAYCKAYAALGMEEYRLAAIRNFDFLWNHFGGTGISKFHHAFKNGQTRFPAFLDDYAYLIAAMIHLQEITGNSDYLLKAKEITEWTVTHFSEEGQGHFFYTHKDQKDVIIRKKEIYDGAVPSGNAVMAFNLIYLSVIFDKPDWKQWAIKNCRQLSGTIVRYPLSFGIWATLLQAITYGIPEIVISGKATENLNKEFLLNFIPYRVFQSATTRNDQFPLLRDKPLSDLTYIFLCRDYSCQSPVTEVYELIRILENV